ncbi:MAG: ribonuclease HI family protein [bacterium]|nr:ribonuclease HI family protein [bacterium]
MKWLIISDGGARGNPGPAASGFAVFKSGQMVFEAGFFWGHKTNNQAEYLGLLTVLGWILNRQPMFGGEKVVIRMDSELVVSQVNGLYKVKSANMKPLYEKVRRMMERLKDEGVEVKVEHRLRDEIAEADRLVNEVLDVVKLGSL